MSEVARLTGKQKRHLRALGHALDPVVQLGAAGLTDAIARQLDRALEAHELVKVRVGRGCPERARQLGTRVAERAGAALAQVLGNTLLVYRRRDEDPKIELPGAQLDGAEERP